MRRGGKGAGTVEGGGRVVGRWTVECQQVIVDETRVRKGSEVNQSHSQHGRTMQRDESGRGKR